MNTRYEFNMDVPPREAIRLLYVSKSRFGGDWNSVPHTHSCTEVFYCVDGRGQFNVEGKMLDVAPDDMVIVNPRTLHTELSYQANPLEYIVLGIEGIEILFDQKDHGYTMLKCGPQREELLSLMQLLLREIDAREDGCEMVCQDLTEVLLVRIVRMASVSLRLTAPPAESKECATAKRYIDENYSESITLDKLAEIAHVNKYYLSHSFKNEYKVSPIDYLMKRRITEAKALLTSTDFSLTQIAEQIGFGSLAYAVGGSLIRFIDVRSLLLIYLGAVFAGIGGGFIGPLAYGIQADNTMYVQYKTGKRAEAAVASLSSFVSKAAQGVAGAIPGYMLAATGFIGGAAQQPQSVEGGIIFCSIMLPLILCAAAGLVFGTLYPLGKKEVDEITLAIEQGVSTK